MYVEVVFVHMYHVFDVGVSSFSLVIVKKVLI